MASTTQISVREYLNTSYRPDCDYIDGEVLERNLGEIDHSLLQSLTFATFWNKRQEWSVVPLV